MTPFPERDFNIGNRSIKVVRCSGSLLPSGPYFVYDNKIFDACRLYDDNLDCFAVTLLPTSSSFSEHGDFFPNRTTSKNGRWKTIAVSSRLCTQRSKNKPLAGLRIAVKDNVKLAGIDTTNGNRAFAELHSKEQETARYVYTLIEKGARIVGKTKTTSFASGEEPTDQWIDFHCPINPRGDTYQKPGSSSSGAAASLAAYHWLDISIGTDCN